MIRRDPARPARRGFTFTEIIVSVTVIVIVVATVVPAFDDAGRLHIQAAADLVTSDIEMARVMTMARPREPVVVGFGPGGTSYWLHRADDVLATPLPRPDTGEPYYVQFGTGRGKPAAGVAFELSGMSGTTLEFDEQGAVADFGSAPIIRMRLDDEWIDVEISPVTGSITQTWGEDPDGEEEVEGMKGAAK